MSSPSKELFNNAANQDHKDRLVA